MDNLLENIRKKNNPIDFKEYFLQLASGDKKIALEYLNHSSLKFPTLFLLIDNIKHLGLNSKLNNRNRTAIKIYELINFGNMSSSIYKITSIKKLFHTLLWIVDTGLEDDGICDEYDQVIDGAISLLIIDLSYYDIMPQIVNLLFERYKKDALIHDLTWAVFQSNHISVLSCISKYLESNNPKEVELARKLLNYSPEIEVQRDNRVQIFNEFIEDNNNYIYFTGESLQLSSNPVPYRLNKAAKYLDIKVGTSNGKLLRKLNKTEKDNLHNFYLLSDEHQELLSDYSHELLQENKVIWKNWLNKTINDQIDIVLNSRGKR